MLHPTTHAEVCKINKVDTFRGYNPPTDAEKPEGWPEGVPYGVSKTPAEVKGFSLFVHGLYHVNKIAHEEVPRWFTSNNDHCKVVLMVSGASVGSLRAVKDVPCVRTHQSKHDLRVTSYEYDIMSICCRTPRRKTTKRTTKRRARRRETRTMRYVCEVHGYYMVSSSDAHMYPSIR
jgi:hypothetical protein